MEYNAELQTLLAERAISRQVIRFAQAMDMRDWDTLGSIAAEDLVADFGTGEVTGRPEVITFIRGFLDNCGTTQHMIGNILVDVHGRRASSTCYVADIHLDDMPDSDASFRTLGMYTDSWEQHEDQWLLTRRIKDNRATIGTMDVFNAAKGVVK